MAEDTPEPTPELSAAALREWGDHVESVMRGIAHALNNRAAALSAVIELASEPDDDPASTAAILSGELQRVRDLVEVVRCMGPPRRGAEAFAPKDAAQDAMAVLTLHAEQRDYPVTIEASSAPPTRVQRWMFVRALIALAASASGRSNAPARITVLEDGDWLVTRVEGNRTPCGDVSPYSAELARVMGGGPLDQQCGFRVPTLATIRQREGR